MKHQPGAEDTGAAPNIQGEQHFHIPAVFSDDITYMLI